MSITGNALADFGLYDRKTALVRWAERWDDISDQLTAGGGFIDAETQLLSAVRPLAHPLLDADTVSDLFMELRTAVGNRVTFDMDGLAALPDEFSDMFPGSSYEPEVVDQRLETDISLALWPLLTGLNTHCVECARTKADVLDWDVPVRGLRCNRHAIILVRSS